MSRIGSGCSGAAEPAPRSSLRTRLLVFLAAHFGTVFVLALMQRAEGRTPYETMRTPADRWPPTNGSTVKCCAGWPPAGASSCPARSGRRCSAPTTAWCRIWRWCWVSGRPESSQTVLFTGVAGLLAGALSMGAGEYVSVRSQRELLQSTRPDPGPSRPCRTSTWTPTSSRWSTGRGGWSPTR